MTIGDKIIELRKKYNYTQERLANLVGVSRQTLSNWEGNITSPDLKQAQVIAKLFKVSLDDLVDNNTEVECIDNQSILSKLVGKTITVDTDTDDYRLDFMTPCKVLEVDHEFLKIEFKSGKKIITKLIDLNLIFSITLADEGDEK